MNAWDIISACLAGAALIYFIFFFVISRVKAKKLGIIRVKFPANKKTLVCNLICAVLNIMLVVMRVDSCVKYAAAVNDLQTLGYREFQKEYYDLDYTFESPEAEQSATEKLLSEYREKYDHERLIMELQTLTALGFACAALFNGAYITKRGVIMFGDIKPRKTAVCIKDGMLCFRSEGKNEYTMLRLPASEENLRLYSDFMVKDNERAAASEA